MFGDFRLILRPISQGLRVYPLLQWIGLSLDSASFLEYLGLTQIQRIQHLGVLLSETQVLLILFVYIVFTAKVRTINCSLVRVVLINQVLILHLLVLLETLEELGFLNNILP